MKGIALTGTFLILAGTAFAQDQQLGARTKAMGGSYTAFEDDPVSIWLNPAGIATQTNQGSIAYQTYTTYPLHQSQPAGSNTVNFSTKAESTLVDPAFVPSFLGLVFQVGTPEVPMAVGVCFARPYHLNYSFAQVQDPLQTNFTPSSNMEQSFSRFRVAFATDFRLKPAGEAGFFTHVAVGAGLDIGYERWHFTSDAQQESGNATAPGAGAGVLLNVFDNTKDLKINFGAAYQSAVRWNFDIDPNVLPAFDMPQQFNLGVTGYFLDKSPLRITVDFQWVQWHETAVKPLFDGQPSFRNAANFSIGSEYRIPLNETLSLYPRLGYRRFEAPWKDENNLPMTGNFKLVNNPKDSTFNIVTFGVGLSWSSDGGKIRSVDIAADAGGDAANFALGFNMEF